MGGRPPGTRSGPSSAGATGSGSFTAGATRGLGRAEDITRPILERYQRHLFLHRKKDGRPLSYTSQLGRIVAVRGLFRWLTRGHVLLSNPAADLDLPRREHRLPRAVLNEEEAERVLATPDVTDSFGIRDRAMLESSTRPGSVARSSRP